jgi:hypothetical protein
MQSKTLTDKIINRMKNSIPNNIIVISWELFAAA